ncbi:hypothetical protein D9M71_340740 [compost metagenome]
MATARFLFEIVQRRLNVLVVVACAPCSTRPPDIDAKDANRGLSIVLSLPLYKLSTL